MFGIKRTCSVQSDAALSKCFMSSVNVWIEEDVVSTLLSVRDLSLSQFPFILNMWCRHCVQVSLIKQTSQSQQCHIWILWWSCLTSDACRDVCSTHSHQQLRPTAHMQPFTHGSALNRPLSSDDKSILIALWWLKAYRESFQEDFLLTLGHQRNNYRVLCERLGGSSLLLEQCVVLLWLLFVACRGRSQIPRHRPHLCCESIWILCEAAEKWFLCLLNNRYKSQYESVCDVCLQTCRMKQGLYNYI